MTTERWDGKESIVYRPKDVARPASTLLVLLQCTPTPVRDAPLESAVMTPIISSQEPLPLRFERAEAYQAQIKPEEKPTAYNKVPVFKSGLYGRSKLD